jgi:hypothetical protein
MRYPKSFKEDVRKAYPPNHVELHRALESNSVILGRHLNDSSLSEISPEMIMEATSLQELQAKAKLQLEKIRLYSEWCKLYQNQHDRISIAKNHCLSGVSR